MADSGRDTFLIDGFPRNEENRAGFEKQVSSLCEPGTYSLLVMLRIQTREF